MLLSYTDYNVYFFRQNLKWPSANHVGELDESCAWNVQLVSHVLPRTLHHMMTSAIQMETSPSDVAKLFPDIEDGSHWCEMLESFYDLIQDEEVLYSEEDGGKWVTPADAKILDDVTPRSATDVVRRVLLESEEESNLVEVCEFVRRRLRDARGQDIDAVSNHYSSVND